MEMGWNEAPVGIQAGWTCRSVGPPEWSHSGGTAYPATTTAREYDTLQVEFDGRVSRVWRPEP